MAKGRKTKGAKGAAGLMQLDVPGTTPEKIPELEAVARPLKTARYDRINLQAQEQQLEKDLIVLMKRHHITAYPVGDKTATLETTEPKEKIKFVSAEAEEKTGE